MLENAKLVDQNLIGIFKYFGLQEKQLDNAKYYLLQTGCNHPLWNMIILPDKVNIAQMDRIEEPFKAQNLPFAWWISDRNISPEMQECFKNGNYIDFGDVPGMVYELKNYEEHINNGNIKVVTEVEGFKKWIQVLMQSFRFNDDVYKLYFSKLSKFIDENKVFIPLAAYDGNDIVATASIIFANGIAGFYNDSTLPEYRNKGIATELYKARFKILQEMGIDQVTIQTSPMATSITTKLGFKKYKDYKIYCRS